jgi:hypothetical protein
VCEICDNIAKYYNQENGEFVCEECSKELDDDDKLNIVNFPRTGVCGYQ